MKSIIRNLTLRLECLQEIQLIFENKPQLQKLELYFEYIVDDGENNPYIDGLYINDEEVDLSDVGEFSEAETPWFTSEELDLLEDNIYALIDIGTSDSMIFYREEIMEFCYDKNEVDGDEAINIQYPALNTLK